MANRVEWQLRADSLRRDFGRGYVDLHNIALEDCYSVYRELCVRIAVLVSSGQLGLFFAGKLVKIALAPLMAQNVVSFLLVALFPLA